MERATAVNNQHVAVQPDGTVELLCLMRHHLLDFRHSEVEALAALAGVPTNQLRWRRPFGDSPYSPFWYLTLPSLEAAQQVAARSFLIKGFFELWGEGATWEELRASVEAFPAEKQAPWYVDTLSFRVVFETFGVKLKHEEQVALIHRLGEFLPFKGRIDLKSPDAKFWLFVCDCRGANGLPDTVPYRLYFGREVATSDRSLIETYKLCRRMYIGPTSMDHEMAFVMANHAKVRRGSIVLDPYVGTGSVIIAAAHYGARVLGADIDVRVIRDGKTSADCDKESGPVDCFSNFDQYRLQRPDGLLRMDMHRHAFRPDLEEMFDAIIGDPPYGVRAGGRKSAPRENCIIRDITNYFPQLQPYSMAETFRDLLDVAARLLVIGGRLVFFMPATPETYTDDEVPAHPGLHLVANCEQVLTTRYSRRLVTMEKHKKYDAAEATAYHEALGPPVMAVDRVHNIVYEAREKEQTSTPKPGKKTYRSKAH